MKDYKVTVNGTIYQVSVEEIKNSDGVGKTEQIKPLKVQNINRTDASELTGSLKGEKVTAPMPGTILDIKVKAGDTVKAGDAVLILEAMKMENDIVAPCDGKIESILVKKGDSVNSNDILVSIVNN